jgi:PhnB protein
MSVSATGNPRPVPEGYHSVTPWIISRDSSRLIEFLTAAFSAEEIARVVSDDGSIVHAEVRIGDSVLMFDAEPHWPDTPAFLRLYVARWRCRVRSGLASWGDLGDRDDAPVLG